MITRHFLKKELPSLVLWVILIFAFVLRIYKISIVPPSLNWDEVSHGFNAYSILRTGKDEWGFKFPLIFRAYGDYKLPLYIYLTSLVELLLGLNPLAVRMVSVLSGLGLVFLAYLITKKITKEKTTALFAAFLTAVSPWGLFLSRVAVEANLGALLFAIGLYFLIDFWSSGRKKDLIWMAVCWGFSLHTYNSARILVPLWFLLILFKAFKEKKAKELILPGLILLFFLLPVFSQLFNQSAKARFNWVALIDQGAINQIIEKRSSLGLPAPLPTIFFNKATFFAYYAAKNYLANFSPWYLFFRGGSHYQFSLPDHELLYLVIAPFLVLGIIKALKKKDESRIILVWFLTAFIPSAVTKDAPHVLRSIFVLPTPMILASLGVETLNGFFKSRSIFKGKLIISVLAITVLISFNRWWSDYLHLYPQAYSWAWQDGYEEMVVYLKENYGDYQQIFITKRYGEPHEFILFYFPWNPTAYQNDPTKVWDYHANWYWIDGFDKFQFINDWEVMKNVKCPTDKGRCLLITSPNNYPDGWSKVKTISFLDGKVAFDILEK